MHRRRRLAATLTAAGAAAVTGALLVVLGPVETGGVIAMTAVLVGLYQLRRWARHALLDGHARSTAQRDGVAAGGGRKMLPRPGGAHS